MLLTTRSMLRALSFTVVVGSLYLAVSYHDSSSVLPTTTTVDSNAANVAALSKMKTTAEDDARALLGSRLDSWFRRMPVDGVIAASASAANAGARASAPDAPAASPIDVAVTGASHSTIASKQISAKQGHVTNDASLVQDEKGAGLLSANTTSREECLSLYGKRTYFSVSRKSWLV